MRTIVWNQKKGYTLVTLLVFIVMGLTIASAAIVMVMINSRNASSIEIGTLAYDVAESGMENALIRLLRDPTYTGETLSVGTGTATVTITSLGGDQWRIVSVGVYGNFRRTIQVDVTMNILLTINSWRETY